MDGGTDPELGCASSSEGCRPSETVKGTTFPPRDCCAARAQNTIIPPRPVHRAPKCRTVAHTEGARTRRLPLRHLSTGLPVRGSVCPQVCVPTGLRTHRSTCPQAYVPTGLRAHRPTCPKVYVPTGLHAHRSTCPRVYMPTGLRAHRSTCPQVYVLAGLLVRSATKLRVHTATGLHAYVSARLRVHRLHNEARVERPRASLHHLTTHGAERGMLSEMTAKSGERPQQNGTERDEHSTTSGAREAPSGARREALSAKPRRRNLERGESDRGAMRTGTRAQRATVARTNPLEVHDRESTK